MYGPTETTISSTVAPVAISDRPVTIGWPIANTQIYLLDRQMQPVPVGVPGELYISGMGLARGYLNRPDLTAERFVPNPFLKDEGGRRKDEAGSFILPPSSFILYKTGDLARYRPDGNIEFLGRLDQQVKLRGYRIELGEVEAALRRHSGVRDVAVQTREDTPGDARLVAYVVPSREQETGDKGQQGTVSDTAFLSPVTSHLSPEELRAFLAER